MAGKHGCISKPRLLSSIVNSPDDDFAQTVLAHPEDKSGSSQESSQNAR
jgi:hypothetical protein